VSIAIPITSTGFTPTRVTSWAATADQAASGAALPFALTEGFQAAFVGGAAVAIVGVLVALFVVRGRDVSDAAVPADVEAALEPA